jgi:HrpA-like RNA helicase
LFRFVYPSILQALLAHIHINEAELLSYHEGFEYEQDQQGENEDVNGAILVFLTGLMEITTLYDTLMADREMFGDPNKFKVRGERMKNGVH